MQKYVPDTDKALSDSKYLWTCKYLFLTSYSWDFTGGKKCQIINKYDQAVIVKESENRICNKSCDWYLHATDWEILILAPGTAQINL